MVKNAVKQIAMALLSLAIIFYIVLQLMLSVGSTVEVENAVYHEANAVVEVEAYLFRDEIVLSADSAGTKCYLADDGEKVTADTEVCVTYTEADDATVQEQIKALRTRIEILEQSGVDNGYSISDHKIIEGNISDLLLDFGKDLAYGSYEGMGKVITDLLIQENRRYALTQTVSNYGMQINACKTEIAYLESTLTGEKTVTKAGTAGYYYSSADGYEDIFTTDALSLLTLDSFESLISSSPDAGLMKGSAGKIVTSPYWYLVCKTTRQELGSYSSGADYRIVFPYSSDVECGMTLTKVITQTDSDDILLVFKTKTMPEGMTYSRKQTVDIITGNYAGLKITASAVRVLDGIRGVYVLDGNEVVFKKVRILYEDGGSYICALPDDSDKCHISQSELSLYDLVIVSGTDIYVGKVLK